MRRPVILSGRKITPSEMAILHLLELVSSNADNQDRNRGQARCPDQPEPAAPGEQPRGAGSGSDRVVARPWSSWGAAIAPLAANPDVCRPAAQVELNSPLLQLATTRGKLLELMSLQVRPGDAVGAERAFTAGIMSLADALFSMPMADILENVELAETCARPCSTAQATSARCSTWSSCLKDGRVGGRKLLPKLREIERT